MPFTEKAPAPLLVSVALRASHVAPTTTPPIIRLVGTKTRLRETALPARILHRQSLIGFLEEPDNLLLAQSLIHVQPPAATLDEVRAVLEAWRDDYNHRRPHGSLGRLIPSEFAARGQKTDPEAPEL